MLLERVFGAGFELVEVPAGLGDADDGDVEGAAFDHRLERGEDFFVGEVAGGAEEDEGVGVGCGGRNGFDVGQRRLLICDTQSMSETGLMRMWIEKL